MATGGVPQEATRGGRFSTVSLAQASSPHSAGVSRVALERRRKRTVLTGGYDGGMCLLNLLALDEPPRAVIAPSTTSGGAGHPSKVQVLKWLPEDNRLFVSGSGDQFLKVWDATSVGASVVSINLRSPIAAADLCAGAEPLAAAALADNTVRLADLRLGRAAVTLQGHTQPPLCVAWGEAGSHQLFSGGKDGTVRAWDKRVGARSLFLFDPYADDSTAEPLKKLERGEVESFADKGPRQARVQKLDMREAMKARIEPYVRPCGLGSFLGSHRARVGKAGDPTKQSAPVMSSSCAPLGSSGGASPSRPAADDQEHERLRREKWAREAQERARHFMDPPRREYAHEASCAHRGAAVALAFCPRRPPGRPHRLLSCGVDGKVRVWDPTTGYLAGPRAFDVECSSLEQPLQIGALGECEDICLVPEKHAVAVYCAAAGELLCSLAAHTAPVTCIEALGARSGLPPNCAEVLSGGEDGRLLCWRAEGRFAQPKSERTIEID